MKHKHHIIPKHEGGTDDPENIVYLSVSEHAEAHKELYEKNGKIEDYLAWKGLSGIIGKEEIVEILMIENGKKLGNLMLSEKKGIFRDGIKEEEKYKDGISRGGKTAGKMMSESGHCKRVAHLGGGKNLGKKYWYNPTTKEETASFDKPGDNWVEGVNMDRVNLEFLRKNADNVKGSFWIKNESTGETRMVKNVDDIPMGFKKGRYLQTENVIDLCNTSKSFPIVGIPQIENRYSFIIFNPSNLRWELIPRINGRKIIKISHTDYYSLIWIRDIVIGEYLIDAQKSGFNFDQILTTKEAISELKGWREFVKISKILDNKKLKKWRREYYSIKLNNFLKSYNLVESIRNKIIPASYISKHI